MYSQKLNCAASLFPKQSYNVLTPNFYTHISVRDLFLQNRSVYFAAARYVNWSWEYINCSQTHEWRNWDWGHAIPFQGIHELDFRYSVSLMYRIATVWLYIKNEDLTALTRSEKVLKVTGVLWRVLMCDCECCIHNCIIICRMSSTSHIRAHMPNMLIHTIFHKNKLN